jgi:xanthine dehydrogenase YagT iron-sulfur-binding subunit
MSNTSRSTSSATPEANAPDPSAKTAKEKSENISVSVTVNGCVCTMMVEPRMTLLDALREELGLTGTKKACDRGECGACTVHVDGRRVLSCMTLAAM